MVFQKERQMTMADMALSKTIPNEVKTAIDLSKFEPQVENPDETLRRKVLAAKFDVNKSIPDTVPLIRRDGIDLHRRQNFSVIVGLEGSRKTWFSLSIAAAFYVDYLGFESVDRGILLWIDTEQADTDLKSVTDRFFRITGVSKSAENIHFLALREYNAKERAEITEMAIKMFSPDLVILDGGADLLAKGANDEQDSTTAVNDLMRWTKIHNCHIVNIIHNSHGNEKARGHYGSIALRKSELAYILTSDGDRTDVKFGKTRMKKPDEFSFCINPDTVLPELTTVPNKEGKVIKLENLFKQVLPPPNTATYADLVNKISETKSVQPRQAKRNISEAKEAGIIEDINGYYSLIINAIDENENLPF